MKVLAVDDTKNDRLLLTKILSSAGYDVKSACNGIEALHIIENEKPDLIISDIMMPEMDGFMLCMELKKNHGTSDIPIIFYTATYTEYEDEKLAMLEGAAGFIRKPEEPLKIIEIIKNTMGNYAGGKCAHFEPEIKYEKEYFSLYSQRLLKKLEDKVIQLGITNRILDAAFEESKSLDRLKSNILSNVTHDLRTQLFYAIGYLELAMGDTGEPGKTECFEKCRDALLRENEIIANLIENSNREENDMNPYDPNLENLLDDVIRFNQRRGEITDCREDKTINQFSTFHPG
ncbi:MAG: response regulator [Candidatus Methanoperedens sp.]|nr:response regulator [Candidatus Methanoperedens sp.]